MQGGVEVECKPPLEEKCKPYNRSNIIIYNNSIHECVEGAEENSSTPPPPAHAPIDYINSMRDVEHRGRQWFAYRNSATGRQDIPTSAVKKEFIEIMKMSFEEFKSRVDIWVNLKLLVKSHKAEKLFFFRFREWDL
ncbi:MAG: hypothetical protein LBG52_05615 [Candidatus Peribacteria bacterium]|nr:hypothetical protein [Candidatus Peribacteria bacterium]